MAETFAAGVFYGFLGGASWTVIALYILISKIEKSKGDSQ